MGEILFTGLTLNELLEKVGQLIDGKLERLVPKQAAKSQSQFITRKEVSRLLKITLPTLHEWTKTGLVQSYKIGNRVLYKLEEIEAKIAKLATYKFRKGGHYAA